MRYINILISSKFMNYEFQEKFNRWCIERAIRSELKRIRFPQILRQTTIYERCSTSSVLTTKKQCYNHASICYTIITPLRIIKLIATLTKYPFCRLEKKLILVRQ